jgi:hypothetical protein
LALWLNTLCTHGCPLSFLQKLRAGVLSVARWLAVRVVWWEQRGSWCELLYR